MKNFSISEDVFVVQGCFYFVVNKKCTIFTSKGNWNVIGWRMEEMEEGGDQYFVRFFTDQYNPKDGALRTTIRIWQTVHDLFQERDHYIYPDFNVNMVCYDLLLDFLNKNCCNIEISKLEELYDNE